MITIVYVIHYDHENVCSVCGASTTEKYVFNDILNILGTNSIHLSGAAL